MKQKFDLHTHTTASDGALSPSDLVRKAKDEGLEVIAITDHDTVGGITEAITAANNFGIKLIPGVEISIDFSPGTLHLCGYFIDINSKAIRENLVFLQRGRSNRNIAIIKKLNDLGMSITIEEVAKVAGADVIGRPHFAKALQDKGYVSSRQEAFDKLLAKGKPCYVDRIRLSDKDALDMIKSAGGIASLAHPAQLKLNSNEEYKEFFKHMRRLGVDGIEVYSSHNSDEQNMLFYSLAQELSMIMTGGSDFHQNDDKTARLGVFGTLPEIDLGRFISLK